MISVFCDLDLKMYMYCVPSESRKYLKSRFENVDFHYSSLLSPNTCHDYNVYWGNRPPANVLSLLPDLQWIHLGCVGRDRINLINEDTSHIKLTNSPDSVTDAVASHTLFQLFYFLRDGYRLHYMNENSDFQNRSYYNKSTVIPGSAYRLNVAIIGFGNIGKSVGCALKSLGAYVKGYATREYKYHGISVSPLEKFLGECSTFDCIISLLPLHNELDNFFNKEVLCSLQDKCILINNGRSSHVDEFHLHGLILQRKIRFASDTVEAPAVFTDLYQRGFDVMISPHIAAVGPHYWPKQIDLFSNLLQDFLDNYSH